VRFSIALLAALAACSSPKREAPAPAHDAAAQPPQPAQHPRTINEFFTQGTPTFIVGTAGDDAADRAIRTQASMIRDLLFPDAPILTDTEIDRTAWPSNPVLYGGPHVNSLVAALDLPATFGPNTLTLGAETYEGADIQLIAVFPSTPQHPELLLFAGTGTPGTGEINSVSSGPDAIQINDAFGKLATGTWLNGAPNLAPRARRIAWRTITRPTATIAFPQQLAPTPDEPATIAAIERGLTTARDRLELTTLPPLTVYVYPDARSKQSLTGNSGHGHASVETGALHVLAVAPDKLQPLIAHEGTHAIAFRAWGAAGTPLLGEGLAIWVAGGYQGRALEKWATEVAGRLPLDDLLFRFRRSPENVAYPLAGLLVENAVRTIGLAKLRDHLYGAPAREFAAACAAAGTTPAALVP
jgi:hypothetical protein